MWPSAVSRQPLSLDPSPSHGKVYDNDVSA